GGRGGGGQGDLLRRGGGEVGEGAEVVVRMGPLAEPLADQVFVVDQVEGEVGGGRTAGEPAEVVLGRDALAGPPALPLVHAEDGGEGIGRPRPGAGGGRREGGPAGPPAARGAARGR